MNITTCVRCCDRRSVNGRIVYMGSQDYKGSKIIKVCMDRD